MLKRYVLFAGYQYYPNGGWKDFKGSFCTLVEAESEGLSLKHSYKIDWYEIVDTVDIKVVSEGGDPPIKTY